MHRPDDTITAALWDHSRSSLVLAGNRLGVWKNKGAIQSSKHTHEAPVTAALFNSHFHQVFFRKSFGFRKSAHLYAACSNTPGRSTDMKHARRSQGFPGWNRGGKSQRPTGTALPT